MDIAPLVRSASLLETVKYINVASGAVFLTDYVQTFDMEVEHIWKSKMSIANVLFYLSRYLPFIDLPMVLYYALAPNISNKTCFQLYVISSGFTAFGIGVAESIMVLRTYALWGNNRRVLVFLMGLIAACYIPVIVFLVVFFRSLKYGDPPLPTVLGCYPTEGSIILFGDFAILMFLEATIMAMTLWIGYKRFRHSRNPLVRTLYRDGIFYFVYLFLISAGNVIVLVAGPPEYVDLLNTFQRVMHSVLSTRTMLHVRDTARRDMRTTEREETTGSLAFTTLVPSTAHTTYQEQGHNLQ
ncbi:hypothetical protein Hypma_000493 [Hypsizygus marmoreus]|uniref:DUF6533 domain-containing protein n=1 Tax=Hypsizygus marmoreus TaxID=39966 RepID=A0A369JAE9_HYPMA|nr:hypothetical protein Hypma_000493 [Hypsizygus marmoreus]